VETCGVSVVKEAAMFVPFDHRIRFWVGLSLLVVLLLVGGLATLALVHTP
jgi:hypothetical protein